MGLDVVLLYDNGVLVVDGICRNVLMSSPLGG